MSAAAPSPAPSFVITRTEEWPDADFDLPDDQETLAIDNEENDLTDSVNRIKGRPSLSGAGAVAKLGGAPVEDEDWDAEFEDAPIKSATASSVNSSTSHFSGKITRLGSTQPRKAKENVEDWSDDGDLELPEPSHTNFTLARAPLPQPNAPEPEDTGDVSTIKIAKLNFPSATKSSTSLKPAEDEDFEADFALPADMSNLSLRHLTPQTSSLSLRKSSTLVEGNGPWGDLTTSSTYSDTSSLLSMYPPDASPSTSSASQLGTETDPSDADFAIYEDEEEAFEGLILPEGLAGKSLAKHLETKKQIVPAKIAADNDAKGSLTSQSRRANEAEDFETDLVIGDEDISISRLRQRRMANPSEYRSKSVPLPRTASGGYRPSSSRLRPESVAEVLSASKAPTISRSRSPSTVSQRSLSRKDSRSSLVSPTNFSSLRPSSVRVSSSSHASSTANLLSIPGSSSVSGIAPRTAPLKHQKSLGRLQLSSTSPSASTLGQKLGRKASLASLAGDPSTSGTPSTSSTLSARSSGFNASTASSKARQKPESREEADKKKTYAVPPTRPTTPSANPAALRLTMPTSSSRQKIRPSISNVFPPSPAIATPTDRATSPQSNPRRTPTSPRRVRTRSGASNGGTPSSSISSMASATAPKVMRKPKRVQAFSDGTELDAFDDLPEDTEKERKYRVQPVGRGNVSTSRGEKGSSATTTTSGTLGRRSAATLRRPPSSASSHGSVDPPKNTGMQSLRHKPRVDFPVKVAVPEPAPRRKKPTVTAIGGPRKKPMLIRNLGGAGAAKTVGDMKWNPKTLRWEGNEQVLREFDAHAAPSRPALITHLTGSSIGGLMSPTGSMLASGARIVGNMLFDPVRMCWISRLPPEEDEPDVFAGLADDEGDDWEDKAGTIRANTGGANATDDKDWKGSVRSTDSVREMTMSPARSHTRSMSESESEAGDTAPSAFGTRRSVRGSFGGQSVHEEVPGVDDTLVAACRAAEERHKQEMKGWYIRSRSRSRSVKSSTEEEPPVRTHLFDIRLLGICSGRRKLRKRTNPDSESAVFGSTDNARPLYVFVACLGPWTAALSHRQLAARPAHTLVYSPPIALLAPNLNARHIRDGPDMTRTGQDDLVRGLLNSRSARSGVPAAFSPTPTADAFSLTSPRPGLYMSPQFTERSESPSCYSHSQMSLGDSFSDISDDHPTTSYGNKSGRYRSYVDPMRDSSEDECTENSDVQGSGSNDTLSDTGMLRPVESDTSVSSALSADTTEGPRLSFLGSFHFTTLASTVINRGRSVGISGPKTRMISKAPWEEGGAGEEAVSDTEATDTLSMFAGKLKGKGRSRSRTLIQCKAEMERFLGGGWGRTSSDARPSMDSSKRSIESSVASYIQTPTSPRNGSFSDAIRGMSARTPSLFSASSATSSPGDAHSNLPGIRTRDGPSGAGVQINAYHVDSRGTSPVSASPTTPNFVHPYANLELLSAGTGRDEEASPSRSNSSATLTASTVSSYVTPSSTSSSATLPEQHEQPPNSKKEKHRPPHITVVPLSRGDSHASSVKSPSALSVSFVPLSPTSMSTTSVGQEDVMPSGMLGFPGSPAYNLISLEQAQQRARDRGRSVTHTPQLHISPRPKEIVHKKSKPTLGPVGGGFSSTIGGGSPSSHWSAEETRARTISAGSGPRSRPRGCTATSIASQSTTSVNIIPGSAIENIPEPRSTAPSGAPMEAIPPRQLKPKRSGFLKFFNKNGVGFGNPNISSPITPVHISHNGVDLPPVPKLPAQYQPAKVSSPLELGSHRELPPVVVSPALGRAQSLERPQSVSDGSHTSIEDHCGQSRFHQHRSGADLKPLEDDASPQDAFGSLKIRPVSSVFKGMPEDYLTGSPKVANSRGSGESRNGDSSGFEDSNILSPATPYFPQSARSCRTHVSTASSGSDAFSSLVDPRTPSSLGFPPGVPRSSTDSQSASVIASLREQIESIRKASQQQISNLENQVQSLKAELEVAKCDRCGQQNGRRSEDSIINRPRAPTGTGCRTALGSSYD
ncbi:hypothetical protein FRC11_006239 [Ceratobasidium sp. 423]|nr:hypothetical protein FRC11_006239 [Ceratobasidium sp. 423]